MVSSGTWRMAAGGGRYGWGGSGWRVVARGGVRLALGMVAVGGEWRKVAGGGVRLVLGMAAAGGE
jgi:hypothetical protein